MLYLCGWEDPEAVFTAYNDDGNWITALFVHQRISFKRFGKVAGQVLRVLSKTGQ